MNKIFQFGEKIEEYEFKVINERDARASAGIMFLLGIITLFHFISTHNLFWTNLFTITFIVEFVVRVFINPVYSPYMVLGSLIVSNQQPDWVEAKPKKFAWILGVILGAIMSYFILFDIMTPARLITCLLCLLLLYMESVFGICLGCMIYKKLNMKLYKCAGDTCTIDTPKTNRTPKLFALLLFIALFYGVFYGLKMKYHNTTSSNLTQEQIDAMEFEETEDNNQMSENSDCTPPAWVVSIGKKDMWLEHHGCN
jgi:predicted outer membrane lipoprotein